METDKSHWEIFWWLLQWIKYRKKELKWRIIHTHLERNLYVAGETMVTVIIESRAACVMTELEYNKIIETERKYRQKNRAKVA